MYFCDASLVSGASAARASNGARQRQSNKRQLFLRTGVMVQTYSLSTMSPYVHKFAHHVPQAILLRNSSRKRAHHELSTFGQDSPRTSFALLRTCLYPRAQALLGRVAASSKCEAAGGGLHHFHRYCILRGLAHIGRLSIVGSNRAGADFGRPECNGYFCAEAKSVATRRAPGLDMAGFLFVLPSTKTRRPLFDPRARVTRWNRSLRRDDDRLPVVS